LTRLCLRFAYWAVRFYAGGFLNVQTAGAVSAFLQDFASLLVFCGSFRRFLRKYGDIFLFLCYNTAVHYFLQEVAY